MKVTADTNLLVRLLTQDDERQTKLAIEALEDAELVAVTLPALCELVWVLSQSYGVRLPAIAVGIRRLIDLRNVVSDRVAVEAGLAALDAGGDFADSVIAYQGRWLGAETFVSFDRRAVSLMQRQGLAARLLG
ncbi:MAG TPA: type II toxin-antitoxin system VapC family toxin [Caulobacteraceae bacterium]